jgi:sec-independent protein translocase protein TatC
MADDFEPSEELPEGGPVKSFLEHLEDFRWLLVKVSIALVLAMLVCLFGANYVVGVLKWPLTHAKGSFPGTNQVVSVRFGANAVGNFTLTDDQQKSFNLGTNRFVAVAVEPLVLGTNQVLGWHVDDDPQAVAAMQRMKVELVNLSPAGGFFVAVQVAFYGGMLLAAPFMLYFIVSFVFPALKWKERKYIYRAVFIGGGLFLVGVSFCYFLLMPVALAASQMYSNWLGLGAMQWRAEEYISFVSKFMLGMGLGFELPVVILTLVKLGILNYRMLRAMWRYMIVIVLVLGAVLTTPEVITQVFMAVPLYLLYEITVWIAWYWDQPDRAKARRTLLLAALAGAALLYLAYQYVWPQLRQFLNWPE